MPPPDNFINQLNDTPREDFEGLSPRLLLGLLRDFLGPGSPMKVSNLTEADLDATPLLYFLRRLMGELAEKEIKLTAKGNLPAKLVKGYYATGRLPDAFVEDGISTIRGEDDYLPLQIVKHLLDILGWTKKRHGKLSLTKKGHEARELPPRKFFQQVFLTHAQRFNLAYADAFAAGHQLQFLFPYLLYLLQLLGDKVRPVAAYKARMWRAFPMLEPEVTQYPEAVLHSRLLRRFLDLYGLLALDEGGGREQRPPTVSTNELFRRVFTLDMEARMAPPTEEEAYEKQIKTALFDAEMGSQSWVSDETPPEVLLQFQASIREFEAQRAAAAAEEDAEDSFSPLEIMTEAFLLALFDLNRPFDGQLLAEEVRLGSRMVLRQRALRHVEKWRRQYSAINPIAFELFELPGAPPTGVPNQEVCFFGAEYRVSLRDGRQETYRGEGVVQLTLENGGEWRVSGAQFPGFAF